MRVFGARTSSRGGKFGISKVGSLPLRRRTCSPQTLVHSTASETSVSFTIVSDPSQAPLHPEIPLDPSAFPLEKLRYKYFGPSDVSLTSAFLGIEKYFSQLGPDCQSLVLRPLPGKSLIFFRDPHVISTVLKNPAVFGKSPRIDRVRRFFGYGLPVQPDIEQHKKQRELLSPSFRPDYIRSLTPTILSEAEEMAALLLALSQNGAKEVDFQDLIRRFTFDVIGRTAFGTDFGAMAFRRGESDFDPIQEWDAIWRVAQLLITDLPVPDSWLPEYEKFEGGVVRLENLISRTVERKLREGIREEDRDLLSCILRMKQSGREEYGWITESYLRDELMDMLFAGSDTTSILLTVLMHVFSTRPDIVTRLRAELDQVGVHPDRPDSLSFENIGKVQYLYGTLHECMRLYPSAVEIARVAKENVVVGGGLLPAGKTAVLSLWSLHRNEVYWPRPLEFLPERWIPGRGAEELGPRVPEAFQGWGTGSRSCIGRHQALLEASIAAIVLLRRVGDFRPGEGAPKQLGNLKLAKTLSLNVFGGLFISATR